MTAVGRASTPAAGPQTRSLPSELGCWRAKLASFARRDGELKFAAAR